MTIKHNHAVSTTTHKEFRCLGIHNEWYLYQADNINGINGNWILSRSSAGVKETLGNFKTSMQAITAAYIHANS